MNDSPSLVGKLVFLPESAAMAPIRYFVKAQGAFDGFGEKSLYDDAGPDSAKPGGNAGAGWIDNLFPFL
jgi:hypothetical protein